MTDQKPVLSSPGEILNWPMLKIVYRTDAENIAKLLPPGIEPGAEANVNITIYNFPVNGAPEYGVVMSVNADYQGIHGEYTLGIGIDQEEAIFISHEMNGQPKFPCATKYYRLMNSVFASCVHQGYTFLEFSGESTVVNEPLDDFEQNEWWIKSLRGVSTLGQPDGFDFPPHVVRVRTKYGTAQREAVSGELILNASPWDPIATLLPIREQLSAHLWWPTFLDRELTLAGTLDPDAFMPYADVISGSRWPGENGGPRKS